MAEVGDVARRTRRISARGSSREVTAEVDVVEARRDRPLTRLRTTIANQDGVVVLDGTALVWTEPL